MTYGKHPHYDTPRDRDRDAWDEEIETLVRATAPKGTRKGVG